MAKSNASPNHYPTRFFSESQKRMSFPDRQKTPKVICQGFNRQKRFTFHSEPRIAYGTKHGPSGHCAFGKGGFGGIIGLCRCFTPCRKGEAKTGA